MNTHYWTRICRDMQFFWIIATLSLCLGLLVNQLRNIPISLKYQTKVQRLRSAVTEIAPAQNKQIVRSSFTSELSLNDFRAFVEQKHGLVLDARPEIFYRLGHVPGALSFPREEFEGAYSKFRAKLELDKSQAIAVYCASDACGDSELVEEALIGLGYNHISVFRGGWSDWIGAGYSEETVP